MQIIRIRTLLIAAFIVFAFAGCTKSDAKPAVDNSSALQQPVEISASEAEVKASPAAAPAAAPAPAAPPPPASAAQESDSVDGFEYQISGSGSGRKVTITEYTGENQVVRIPASINNAPVTVIAGFAFNSKNIRSVTLPAGLVEIGEAAFANNSIARLEIPQTVTSIGDEAFAYNELTSIVIPQGITALAKEVFAHNKLKEVTLPQGLRSIGEGAFTTSKPNALAPETNQISKITFPSSLVSIDDYAFENNNLSELVFPRSLKTVGSQAFHGNSIAKVSIGDNVELQRDALNAGDEVAFMFSGSSFSFEGASSKPPFTLAYAENKLKGGSYTLSGGKWNYAP
jgi:hypothetical protein